MNKITQQIKSVLRPMAALIAYENENDSDNRYFLEMRRIDERGVMGEGVPVAVEFMKQLSKAFSGSTEKVLHGLVPPNMLWCDPRKGYEQYVWWNPPCKRAMYFASSLGIDNGEYYVPGVVYVANQSGLNIYAYHGTSAPQQDTPLYNAPFFNVSGGAVCLGTAKARLPADPTYDDMLDCWERKFWGSVFTHINGGNPTKNNLVLITKAAKDAPFPEDEMLPMNITLKNLLK